VLLAEVDHHPPRLRQEPLLRDPALLAQGVQGPGPEILGREPGPLEHQLEEHLVEVVAAEAALAVAAEDGVPGAVGLDERAVEGAAAEVVHRDPGAARGEAAGLVVGVLEAGGGGLVEHRDHVDAGAAEGLERHDALGRVGVGGDRDGDLPGRDRQRLPHRGEIGGHQVQQQVLAPAELHHRAGMGARISEQPLEGAQVRGARAGRALGLEAVDELAVDVRDHRGEVVPAVPVGVGEVEDGIVAAVHARRDGAGGAHVDSDAHGLNIAGPGSGCPFCPNRCRHRWWDHCPHRRSASSRSPARPV
jgi:hypothetical protein